MPSSHRSLARSPAQLLHDVSKSYHACDLHVVYRQIGSPCAELTTAAGDPPSVRSALLIRDRGSTWIASESMRHEAALDSDPEDRSRWP